MNKVNVLKDYIGYEDMIYITGFCAKQYRNILSAGNVAIFPTIRVIYDMLVAAYTTDMKIDGIEKSADNGEVAVSITLTGDKIDEFLSTKVAKRLSKGISNYGEVWALVLEEIKLINNENSIMQGFNAIIDSIPKGEEIRTTFSNVIGELKEVSENNPDLIKAVAETAKYEKAIKQVRKDITETREKRKAISKENKELGEKVSSGDKK